MRRRRSTSCSSGMSTRNGRIVVSPVAVPGLAAAVPGVAGAAASCIGIRLTATTVADVASSIAAEVVRRDIIILLGEQASLRAGGQESASITHAPKSLVRLAQGSERSAQLGGKEF